MITLLIFCLMKIASRSDRMTEKMWVDYYCAKNYTATKGCKYSLERLGN